MNVNSRNDGGNVMKKLIVLSMLIFIAGTSYGQLDLTKPANNSKVASFPVEARTNFIALNASLTPPISWVNTNVGGTSGSASVKLGFYSTLEMVPTFFLGAIKGSNNVSSYAAIIFGAEDSFPDDCRNLTKSFAFLYDGDSEEIFCLPPGETTNYLSLRNTGIDLSATPGSERKISGLATGTQPTDAVNLGQLSDSINSSVLVVAQTFTNSVWTGAYTVFNNGNNLATFTYELIDTHGAWDGESFIAPESGVYEVFVQFGAQAASEPSDVSVQLFTDSGFSASVASSTAYLIQESVINTTGIMISGRGYVRLNALDTFVISIQAGTWPINSYDDRRILCIKKISDLP